MSPSRICRYTFLFLGAMPSEWVLISPWGVSSWLAMAVRCSNVVLSCMSTWFEAYHWCTHQRHLRSVLILHQRSSRVDFRAVDDELSQLGNIVMCDRLRICELLGEDWRDTDLVRLNVDVRRYN